MQDKITLAIDALASAAFIEGGVSPENTQAARELTEQRKRELLATISTPCLHQISEPAKQITGIRDAVLRGITTQSHSIDSNRVTIEYSGRGKNALDELASNIAAEIEAVAVAAPQAAPALEAPAAPAGEVVYRWQALDFSGYCYGSNPPEDLPARCNLTPFYRQPDAYRAALHEISATGNLTATGQQFARHLKQIARDALAAAPQAPAAPAEAELMQALSDLVNALRERHYGRMPEEVQSAYDKAWAIVFAGPTPVAAPAAPAVDALDAKDRECIAIGRAIQRAAGELPVDGEIRINIENGAGAVYVLEPKHGDWRYIDSGDVFSAQINAAIDAANAAAKGAA